MLYPGFLPQAIIQIALIAVMVIAIRVHENALAWGCFGLQVVNAGVVLLRDPRA